MGKILSLLNEKGGVGKTAVACQLSYFLVAQGKKVLFIDIDHQGNSTKSITLSKKALVSKTTSSRLLKEKVSNIEDHRLFWCLQRKAKEKWRNNLISTTSLPQTPSLSRCSEPKIYLCYFRHTNPNYDITVSSCPRRK